MSTSTSRRRPARPGLARAAAPARTAAAAAPPPPPWWRDGWSALAALAALPLLLACAGAPIGEPVAEDFDFLHRALIQGTGTFLDGGGSLAFWRPLAHQAYYALLGRAVLSHPALVAGLHALLLALGAWLLARAFRTSLPGPLAATAASFPLLAESTRTLVGWPTQFVDVGLYLFSALAVHAAARRRWPAAIASLLAALLCKEVAVVTAVLLPLVPGPASRRERGRAALAIAVAVGAWAAAYLAVRHAAHLELPHGLERAGAPVAGPLARVGWALVGGLRSAFSRPLLPQSLDVAAAGLVAALALAAAVLAARSASVRARLAVRRAWLGWALAWFALATLALTPIYPLWQPNRAEIGDVGLGLACALVLDAAQPWLLAGLVAGRLALLALAPHAAATVTDAPPETGAFMDFAHLARLQRFMRETRALLVHAHPALPRGAVVVRANMPRGLVYAFGGDHALQAWYRDGSLRLVSAEAFRSDLALPAAEVIQFEPHRRPELALVPAAGVRAEEQAFARLRAGDGAVAAAGFARAESLVTDPRPVVFHAETAGALAFALELAGLHAESAAAARHALALDDGNVNARLVLATQALAAGRLVEAGALVDTLLARNPGLGSAQMLQQQIEARRVVEGAAAR